MPTPTPIYYYRQRPSATSSASPIPIQKIRTTPTATTTLISTISPSPTDIPLSPVLVPVSGSPPPGLRLGDLLKSIWLPNVAAGLILGALVLYWAWRREH